MKWFWKKPPPEGHEDLEIILEDNKRIRDMAEQQRKRLEDAIRRRQALFGEELLKK